MLSLSLSSDQLVTEANNIHFTSTAVLSTFERPKFDPGTFEWPKFDPGTFERPKFDPGTFERPKFDPGTFERPKFDPGTFEWPKFDPGRFERPSRMACSALGLTGLGSNLPCVRAL